MSKEQLLDDEQLKTNRTEESLTEIELLRAAEQHYEKRLWTGRLGMGFIGYLFLASAVTFVAGHRFFMINLIWGETRENT